MLWKTNSVLVKDGLESSDSSRWSQREQNSEETQITTKELIHLLRKSEGIMTKIKAFLDELSEDQDSIVNAGLNSRRKLLWIKHFPSTNRLRRALKETVARICALLILKHLYVILRAPKPLRIENIEVPLSYRLTGSISEEARVALRDASQQLVYRRRHGTHNIDTDEQVQAPTTRTLSEELQHSQVQAEKFLSDLNGTHPAGHRKYLQTQFGQSQLPIPSVNQSLTGLDPESPAAGGPRSSFIDWETDSIPSNTIRSLAPYVHLTLSCAPNCRCSCHATQSYGSWSIPWLKRILGSILISYHGTVLWKTACTDSSCLASRAKDLRWLRISYTLPPWLLQMTLSVYVSPGPPTPELLLRVINHLPNVASPGDFWNLKVIVERGDLEALKYSIANRLCSVHDVHHATGQTALLFAIRHERFEMVRILLHAGADIFQGSASTAAVTLLLNRIHTSSPGIKRIASLFPITDIMEIYGYTDLHKIILGIHPRDLADALATNPLLISQGNQPTAAGITPVHLAAIRGSTAQLAALKQTGADFSSRAANKSTPLHLACTNQKSSAARFILDTDKVPDRATTIGMTPLHCIVSSAKVHPEMWEVADRLLELGADIDARATCDVTPLAYAANADSPGAIAYLLSRGANINARDTDGDTALVEAILSNSPECVRVLLDKGADMKAVNKYGRGPIHYLAGAGSEDIIEIFRSTGAFTRGNFDKGAVGKDGLNATDILNTRPHLSVGLREKFQRLLDSIPDYVVLNPDDEDAVDSCPISDSSGDEYADAEEDWET